MHAYVISMYHDKHVIECAFLVKGLLPKTFQEIPRNISRSVHPPPRLGHTAVRAQWAGKYALPRRWQSRGFYYHEEEELGLLLGAEGMLSGRQALVSSLSTEIQGRLNTQSARALAPHRVALPAVTVTTDGHC